MNALGAIAAFDGRTIVPADLQWLATTADGCPPDPGALVLDGWFGLARAGLNVLPPEDAIDRPVTTADGRLCVLFEGRLDNRDELAAALAHAGNPPPTTRDAELFACAAAAWGADAWDRLLGDFAAVVVDRAARVVTAVRDAFGIRPLLYRVSRGGVAVASTVQALSRLGPVTPDERMIGQYLTGVVNDLAGSSCREIRRVPPGHAISFDGRGEHSSRYLTLCPEPIDSGRSDEDYADEMRHLLRESTRARLRGGTVGILVSGGIDSAAITASALADAGATAIRTYSQVIPGSPKDEQRWSDLVVRQTPFARTHTRVPVADVAFDYRAHAHAAVEPALAPTGVSSSPLRRRAQQQGVRVLLSGIGSDELLTGSWQRYADRVRAGRLLRLAREWSCDRRHMLYEGARYALISAIGPLVPGWARPLGRRVAAIESVPPMIAPAFASRVELADWLRTPLPSVPCVTHAQADIWSVVSGGPALLPLEQEQTWAGRFEADERFPFFDRRIVRFALGLPESQRWADATSKVVLRRAMKGLVPEPIRAGIPTHDYSFQLLPTLRRWTPPAGARWQVVERGWVDKRRLDAVIRTFHTAPDAALADRHAALWELWNVIACELLAEAFEQQPVAPHAETLPRHFQERAG